MSDHVAPRRKATIVRRKGRIDFVNAEGKVVAWRVGDARSPDAAYQAIVALWHEARRRGYDVALPDGLPETYIG